MKSYIREHRAAMEAYDRYEAAQKEGRAAEATAELVLALRLEIAAAEGVPTDLEPTRSVLFRSAASIALDAGRAADARRLIAAGLRGNPPPEIKEELLALLDQRSFVQDELQDPLGLLRRGTVVQRLVVRSTSDHAPSAGLAMAVITKIHDAWIDYFESILAEALGTEKLDPPRLEAVHAAVGSFALQLKISGRLNRQGRHVALGLLRELQSLEDLTVAGASPEDAKVSLSRLDRLVSLLTTLRQEGARLDVRMHVVGEDQPAVDLFIGPPSERLLRRLQHAVADRVGSADVPQADSIERVLDLVTHVVRHAVLPAPVDVGLVKRQIAYYRRAAEILGYLREGRPTPIASYVARAPSRERLRHALHRFETSDVGSAWLSWAERARLCEVEPASAEAFLVAASIGLSPATIKRRTKTLKAWHTAFQSVFEEAQD